MAAGEADCFMRGRRVVTEHETRKVTIRMAWFIDYTPMVPFHGSGEHRYGTCRPGRRFPGTEKRETAWISRNSSA